MQSCLDGANSERDSIGRRLARELDSYLNRPPTDPDATCLKAVINNTFGGFGLSDEARRRLRESGVFEDDGYDIARNNSALVRIVEELGERANERYAELLVVKLKPNRRYLVSEYDGMETLREYHLSLDNRTLEWVEEGVVISTMGL